MIFRTGGRELLSSTALVSTIGMTFFGLCAPTFAAAADAPPSVEAVQEVVVTAQRREQNVQDVPIAVTALTPDALATNRVVSVNDLNLLAPGFTVEPAAGGTQIPSFSMRGLTSYGVVPGSDKAISMYVDGVYISSTRASIFELPDISQIEVLRGPQGTLFGRNATAGAVSVTTRNPSGEFHITQDFSVGNESQFRSRTTIDTPTWGPFSGYVSYVRNYQDGDIKNTGAGTVWDYSNNTSSLYGKSATSPKYLGTTDANSFFAALEFAPTDRFTTIYKFDYTQDHGTPNGVGLVAADTAGYPVGTLGNAVGSILNNQPTPVQYAGGSRPNSVNNAFTVPEREQVMGHSLTSTFEGDNFTIKNIASYRQSYIVANDELDGVGGLIFPQAAVVPFATFGLVSRGLPLAFLSLAESSIQPWVGKPFTLLSLTDQNKSRQWSDELQYIYTSKALTVTVGGLVFASKDSTGGLPGMPNNIQFTSLPNFVVPSAASVGTGTSYNAAQSIAGYVQAEYHVTSDVDIIGGMRETRDWKSGTAVIVPTPLADPNFKYRSTRPSYLASVDYKPTDDIMAYAKYSTGFVSGGDVAGIPFSPETAQSWELGFKGEFFEHRLRTNIALYTATYQHLQDSEGGASYRGPLLQQYPFIPALGTFIIDQGGRAYSQGVEFEGTYVVADGLTVGSNIAYTHNHYVDVNPAADSPPGVPPIPTLIPDWTVGLWGNYNWVFDNGLTGTLLINANWRSSLPLTNPAQNIPAYAPYTSVPPTWIVNGRAVLSGFEMHGVNAEVAVWAKNMTNDRSLIYALEVPNLVASGNYQPARTFGLDLSFKY